MEDVTQDAVGAVLTPQASFDCAMLFFCLKSQTGDIAQALCKKGK